MIAYRGIGKNHNEDPLSTKHHAIYFSNNMDVAHRYGEKGSTWQFDLKGNKIVPTSELKKLLSESDYSDLADDYDNADLDESPLFGLNPQAEDIANALKLNGIIDKKGNIELLSAADELPNRRIPEDIMKDGKKLKEFLASEWRDKNHSDAPAYEGGTDLAGLIKDHDMPSRMLKALGMGDHISMPQKLILTVDKFSKGQPFAKLEKGSDRLTYKGRERMKKSEFAIPSEKDKENPAGHGAYPINDIEHARNALARVAQHGPPEEQAEVRRKVHAKYPSIDEE